MQIEDVGRSLRREDPRRRGMQPTPVLLPGNFWRAPANEAAKSQTRLEWLSTHADRQTEAESSCQLGERCGAAALREPGRPEPGRTVGLKRKQGGRK